MDTTTPVLEHYEDTRPMGPNMGTERENLDAWLELYRESALLKIVGLDAEQLCRRAIPSSTLSLMGVLRHLTENEAYWLGTLLLGEEERDFYSAGANRDGDLEDADPATAAADLATYRAEVARARVAAAGWTDLDGPVRGTLSGGRPVTLRWILGHLIEEYARHLGHMDMLRGAVDGRTGF